MTQQSSRASFSAALSVPDIRLFLLSIGFFTFANRALAVVIGFQTYQITHSAMALGWLGLIEAIPAISMAPFGGYIADHFDRRKILLYARAVSVFCALSMSILSFEGAKASIAGLYTLVFLAGLARAFADPAASAFEAQVVPKTLTVNASSWFSSSWVLCGIAGPASIGFIFDFWGAAGSYLLLAAFFAIAWILMSRIAPRLQPEHPHRENIFAAIKTGWKFLFKTQPLVAGMSLDLFAVFFGGAIALLPIYASDILHVGAKGLGILNAAPSVGAMLVMLWATKHPPIEKAGRNLLFAVSGFGLSIIVFAFSKSFALSLAALFFSGVFDGVSMVIRRSIMRLLSPDHLRGRVAAANSIFICASNELGAFESGMGAAWLGTVPCVAAGGAITIIVVLLAARLAPQLRALEFDPHTLERRIPA